MRNEGGACANLLDFILRGCLGQAQHVVVLQWVGCGHCVERQAVGCLLDAVREMWCACCLGQHKLVACGATRRIGKRANDELPGSYTLQT